MEFKVGDTVTAPSYSQFGVGTVIESENHGGFLLIHFPGMPQEFIDSSTTWSQHVYERKFLLLSAALQHVKGWII